LSPKNGDNNSSWFDVPHLSDAFIINLGDLMQRWTNDRWMSTLHRVIAVPDVAGADGDNADDGVFESARRQSIAFFVNVNGRAIISPFDSCVDDEHPSRYDAIMASDYLIRRHAQSMGTPLK
jgi:isopenicillin N synthase-like dioxygenase